MSIKTVLPRLYPTSPVVAIHPDTGAWLTVGTSSLTWYAAGGYVDNDGRTRYHWHILGKDTVLDGVDYQTRPGVLVRLYTMPAKYHAQTTLWRTLTLMGTPSTATLTDMLGHIASLWASGEYLAKAQDRKDALANDEYDWDILRQALGPVNPVRGERYHTTGGAFIHALYMHPAYPAPVPIPYTIYAIGNDGSLSRVGEARPIGWVNLMTGESLGKDELSGQTQSLGYVWSKRQKDMMQIVEPVEQHYLRGGKPGPILWRKCRYCGGRAQVEVASGRVHCMTCQRMRTSRIDDGG